MSDKIIRGKREKFISAIDIEHIELQPSNSESELVFLVNDDSEKRTYKWILPNASSRLSWFTDLTEAIEHVTQGFKAPRNRYHVVNTSSSKISTLRRTYRKREMKTKKLSRIFKIPEDDLSKIIETELLESEKGSTVTDTPGGDKELVCPQNRKVIRETSKRKLISTRSVPSFSNFFANNPASSFVPLQKEEDKNLEEKVNVLLSEKSEWMKKEKALNDKIQSLEKQIQDKENTPFCDKKKPEGKILKQRI